MKKKLFSILLSLAMMVTMMPMMTMTAFATGNEAKIGSTEYATLDDAIGAVQNNETIVMLQDVTYGTSITINNGKTFTIDFENKKFTWNDETVNKDIFTIAGSSNVTVKNMQYKKATDNVKGNRVFLVNSTGTLTLKDMICDSADNIKDTPVRNNGGTVMIDGGNITTNETGISTTIYPNSLNPIIQNFGGTTTFTGNGTYTINSVQCASSAVWFGKIITKNDLSADANNDCGTVIIENGTFNDGPIVSANGKGNITINNATHTNTGMNAASTMVIYHGGIKSNIVVNNMTSSANIFAFVYEALQTKIDFKNGNVKYKANMFCPGIGASSKAVSIKNGKFGPITGSTNIQNEIQNLLINGAIMNALTSDPDGYTYEVDGPACMIGSTGYRTLDDALSAVNSGETITMLEDISYTDGTNFVISGEAVTIDFDGNSITVNTSGFPYVRKLFTVTDSGNLTISNGEIIFDGMYTSMITSFTVSGDNSVLTLKNMQQTENADHLVTNNGGKVYIDGGTFGYGSSTNVRLVITNGGSLNIKNDASFKFQTALINMGESDSSVASPDEDMGTVVIDSGTFEQTGGDTNLIKLYGKSKVTLNGGTWTGPNANSSLLCIENKGYKSSVTINNFTSDSPYVFISANNTNIESFTATVNNGHFKYAKGQFAVDRNNGLKPNIKLNGGFYGPQDGGSPVASADALAEITAFCASGKTVQALESGDSEHSSGYRYKITQNSQPTPPTPTPDPTPTEEYTVPVESENTVQVEATIESGKAAVKEITKEVIEEVTKPAAGKEKADAIVIDLSKAKQEVTAVELTGTTVKNLAEAVASKDNAIEKVTIQMAEATVELDAKTLETVSKEAEGDTIKLVVDKTQEENLKEKQKETLSNYNVSKTFEAYFESNGKRISSFNGGKVVVGIKFTPDAGKKAGNYKVYYVDDEGKIQKFASKYVDGMLKFSTTHFSDYAIVYEGTKDVLLIKANTSGSKAIKLSWNGIDNATKYVIYGAKCGNKYKKLKTVKGKSYTVKKISEKKLVAHKTYKFYVVGYDAVGNKVRSKTIHFITANTQGKYANVKSIKAKYDEMLLSVGVSKKIGATYKMYSGKKHLKKTHGAALRYISNNPEVAKVSKTGKLTAVSVGTATIYIQDIGGKYCKTKVTVE